MLAGAIGGKLRPIEPWKKSMLLVTSAQTWLTPSIAMAKKVPRRRRIG